MKKVLVYVSVSVLVVVTAFSLAKIYSSEESISQINSEIHNVQQDISKFVAPEVISVVTKTQKVAQKIVKIVSPQTESTSVVSVSGLTQHGVFALTNLARKENGNLAPLSLNAQLNQIADLRLKDMFEKQYFEHYSPTGIGASQLAPEVGYSFISIGENIAMGDFQSDKEIVDAWMNSPGHRANILNPRFEEIGIAVGKGVFKGETVWLGVQVFGKPLSDCTEASPALKTQIEQNNTTVTNLTATTETLKSQMQSLNDGSESGREAYNQKVQEYNALVSQVNILVSTTKILVAQYNTAVQVFNECIKQ